MAASPNLLLSEPTPFDPSVTNAWATILNTNFSLLDSAISALNSYSVPSLTGYPTCILTSNSGAADQARSQAFTFTGVLTSNVTILWPAGLNRFFSVKNSCTGAFTLMLAVNNGSGSPAGATYVLPQGAELFFKSDGTNLTTRPAVPGGAAGGALAGFYPNPTLAASVATLNTPDQLLQGGANVDPTVNGNLGTFTGGGTLTVDCGLCPLQYATNNGAFTIAAPATDGYCNILLTNAAGAGAVTFSGFTGPNTGAAMTTTNGNKYLLQIVRINGTALYSILALQ